MRVVLPSRVISGTTIPDVGDNPVLVPPTLQPVVRIPGQVKHFTGLGSTNPTVSDSFICSAAVDRVPSQAAYQVNEITLAAGLWRINIRSHVTANFTEALSPGVRTGITLGHSSQPFTAYLSRVAIVSAFPQLEHVSWLFNFSREGYTLGVNVSGTGVAQNIQYDYCIYGERLA